MTEKTYCYATVVVKLDGMYPDHAHHVAKMIAERAKHHNEVIDCYVDSFETGDQ